MAAESPQERQTQRAAVMLTKSEKEDLRLVSAIDRVSESDLLREKTVDLIVARASEIRGSVSVGATS